MGLPGGSGTTGNRYATEGCETELDLETWPPILERAPKKCHDREPIPCDHVGSSTGRPGQALFSYFEAKVFGCLPIEW